MWTWFRDEISVQSDGALHDPCPRAAVAVAVVAVVVVVIISMVCSIEAPWEFPQDVPHALMGWHHKHFDKGGLVRHAHGSQTFSPSRGLTLQPGLIFIGNLILL